MLVLSEGLLEGEPGSGLAAYQAAKAAAEDASWQDTDKGARYPQDFQQTDANRMIDIT